MHPKVDMVRIVVAWQSPRQWGGEVMFVVVTTLNFMMQYVQTFYLKQSCPNIQLAPLKVTFAVISLMACMILQEFVRMRTNLYWGGQSISYGNVNELIY